MICPKCEKSNKEDARFCAYCGEKLIDNPLDTYDSTEDCEQDNSTENVNVQDIDESSGVLHDVIVQEGDGQSTKEKIISGKSTNIGISSNDRTKESIVATVSNNVKGFFAKYYPICKKNVKEFVAKYYPICKKYVISAASFCKEKIKKLIEKIKSKNNSQNTQYGHLNNSQASQYVVPNNPKNNGQAYQYAVPNYTPNNGQVPQYGVPNSGQNPQYSVPNSMRTPQYGTQGHKEIYQMANENRYVVDDTGLNNAGFSNMSLYDMEVNRLMQELNKYSEKSFDYTYYLKFIVMSLCGLHRLTNGKILSGLLYMFTCGLCFIGMFIDWAILLSGNFTDAKGKPINTPAVMKIDAQLEELKRRHARGEI